VIDVFAAAALIALWLAAYGTFGAIIVIGACWACPPPPAVTQRDLWKFVVAWPLFAAFIAAYLAIVGLEKLARRLRRA
jgi:hypothetical protein